MLKPRARKVKILATLGPASSSPEMIRALVEAGADAFRINMSHGSQAEKAKLVEAIRGARKDRFTGRRTILFDLQGPKLRVGKFKGGSAELDAGPDVRARPRKEPGDASRVELPHPELFEAVKKDARLLIDDGKVRLRVAAVEKDKIAAVVEVGGRVSNNKGVNVPDVLVPIPALTDKDRERPRIRAGAGRGLSSPCRSSSGPRTSPRRASWSATRRRCWPRSKSRRRSSGWTRYWSWPTR